MDHADPSRAAAIKLWREVGPGKTFTFQATMRGIAGADPLLDEIDRVTAAVVRGDSTRLHLLATYGLLTAETSEDGRLVTYKLATTEPPADTRTLVEVEQECDQSRGGDRAMATGPGMASAGAGLRPSPERREGEAGVHAPARGRAGRAPSAGP
jgi:hypothetical protein